MRNSAYFQTWEQVDVEVFSAENLHSIPRKRVARVVNTYVILTYERYGNVDPEFGIHPSLVFCALDFEVCHHYLHACIGLFMCIFHGHC